jgi:hypothetical protein
MKKIVLLMVVLMALMNIGYSAVSESIAGTESIVVTMINQEPDPVAPGNTVDVRFRIENKGSEPAEDMQIKLVPKYPFSLYSSDEEVKNIGTVAGGQRDDIGVREKFTLLVDKNAASGENLIEFWYKIGNRPWTKSGDFFIEVRSREAVLAINEIETQPKTITPGSSTKVTFTLENLAQTSLRDIKLKLEVLSAVITSAGVTTNELPFTPIGSGNEKTLKNIDAKSSAKISFDLFTDADSASKVYKVPYVLTYLDDAGANFTRSGVVGLIVDASPDISISLDSTAIYSAGAKGAVSIKFVNKGFSDIKFLDVVLKDTQDFDILSNQEVYIGNLDSDDYETAEYNLLVSDKAKESLPLPLHVAYRDANGELFEKDLTLNVALFSGNELKKRSGAGGNSFVGIVIVLIIVGVGIYIYRRRKKKKA